MIIAVYNPPANSCTRPHSKIYFEQLDSAPKSLKTNERVLVCGDFNARIFSGRPVVKADFEDQTNGQIDYVRLENVDRRQTIANVGEIKLLNFRSSNGHTPLNGL